MVQHPTSLCLLLSFLRIILPFLTASSKVRVATFSFLCQVFLLGTLASTSTSGSTAKSDGNYKYTLKSMSEQPTADNHPAVEQQVPQIMGQPTKALDIAPSNLENWPSIAKIKDKTDLVTSNVQNCASKGTDIVLNHPVEAAILGVVGGLVYWQPRIVVTPALYYSGFGVGGLSASKIEYHSIFPILEIAH